MSKLHIRQMALRSALACVTDRSPSGRPVPSCKGAMIDEVVKALGIEGAASAEVFADIVDLAVINELARAGAPFSEEVALIVKEFQADCIDTVVSAQLGRIAKSSDGV